MIPSYKLLGEMVDAFLSTYYMQELEESKLGTKSYWDKVYDREISNYNSFEDKVLKGRD